MGGLHEEDQEHRSRLTQRPSPRMETNSTAPATATTAPPAAARTKTTISNKTCGLTNSTGFSKPTATVSTASKAHQANGHKTKEPHVMQLARTLKKQNHILIYFFVFLAISNLLPLSFAMNSQGHIVMFNQVGQMASSMAYIHAAIPLNISTYQHHISLFQTTLDKLTNMPTSAQKTLQKSIKEMAFFASKRLNKLATKIRTIDNVLLNDDLSRDINSRQKRFIDSLFAPALR